MFPTKTSGDVGIVDCVSDATGRCMEKPTGGRSPGTRRCILSTFAGFKTHFGYTFIIPTSDNLLMRLGSVYRSALLPSKLTEICLDNYLSTHAQRILFPMWSMANHSNLPPR